jgi:hypothetical protein
MDFVILYRLTEENKFYGHFMKDNATEHAKKLYTCDKLSIFFFLPFIYYNLSTGRDNE